MGPVGGTLAHPRRSRTRDARTPATLEHPRRSGIRRSCTRDARPLPADTGTLWELERVRIVPEDRSQWNGAT
ncbi:hypothetical protein D4764_0179110 [Takifugu flavidus]|uniref:Uncharacterized protein n=1 Tax=Takifugu flavidus TaxID=433684 RepID=A0A5C6MHZ2_9TELE|nr:hypothetical protein D4764_0179110 [Takifugu flavidus]